MFSISLLFVIKRDILLKERELSYLADRHSLQNKLSKMGNIKYVNFLLYWEFALHTNDWY